MAHRVASKLTLTPACADTNQDQRLTEQSLALDIVAKYGGHIETHLCSDQVLLSIITYPDQELAVKAQMPSWLAGVRTPRPERLHPRRGAGLAG